MELDECGAPVKQQRLRFCLGFACAALCSLFGWAAATVGNLPVNALTVVFMVGIFAIVGGILACLGFGLCAEWD